MHYHSLISFHCFHGLYINEEFSICLPMVFKINMLKEDVNLGYLRDII